METLEQSVERSELSPAFDGHVERVVVASVERNQLNDFPIHVCITMNDILHGLNHAQRDAVTSSSSVLQVLAPPGSGKTKTLTARVAYLLAEHQLKPWNIIVCTFTVKAAREMKERVKTMVGDDLAKQLKLGTFHSISLRYLKQYGQHIGLSKDFGVADSADSKAIVKCTIKKYGFSIDPGQARSRISAQKAKGIGSEEFAKTAKHVEQQEFSQVYSGYEATLAASNLLDYDDLLVRCCFLMRSHPQCVSNVEAVLIDEFQDTNCIQYDLMGLFAQKRNNVTIVGDPDQSIYGFRSAEIKNLARMKSRWPDTLTINLEQNYRSSGAILRVAQHIIEQDETRPPKKLQATHSPGLRPVLRKLPSATAEAEWLVSEVKRMQGLTGNMLQASDFAVLLRSASLSRVIETALGKAGVPYRMVGGTRFYDRAEVKLILDYLRVIDQPSNSEAVQRIVNVPPRRIGDASIKALVAEAQSKGCTLWSLLLSVVQGRCRPASKLSEAAKKGLAEFVNVVLTAQKKLTSTGTETPSLTAVVNLLLQKLDVEKYLRSKYPDDYEARWANVEELLAQADDASSPEKLQSMANADALPLVEGFEQRSTSEPEDALSVFLANVALTASSEEKADNDGETVQQLTISTIHAAKGLEWPVVFIPACYDGSIPHSRAEDHDEERRLLYVGMTRAQAALYLSCPIKNTQREDTTMSTFLLQSGVSTFFEEHGPSISATIVDGLAKTLRRDCPWPEDLVKCKQGLECDEDDHWPLNGEMPLGKTSDWNAVTSSTILPASAGFRPASVFNSASVTMQNQEGFSTASTTTPSGFVSVKAKYDDLMEQSALQNVDKRAEASKVDMQEKPKGRKRQMEGQGTIASFFNKRTKSPEREPPAETERPRQRPLCEVSSTSAVRNAASGSSLPQHKLRTEPTFKCASSFDSCEPQRKTNQYVFLSSSPAAPEQEAHQRAPNEAQDEDATENQASSMHSRPATTLHTTSVQSIAPQRKTLGVKRSLNGWNSRMSRQ